MMYAVDLDLELEWLKILIHDLWILSIISSYVHTCFNVTSSPFKTFLAYTFFPIIFITVVCVRNIAIALCNNISSTSFLFKECWTNLNYLFCNIFQQSRFDNYNSLPWSSSYFDLLYSWSHIYILQRFWLTILWTYEIVSLKSASAYSTFNCLCWLQWWISN